MPKLTTENQGRVGSYLQSLHDIYGVSIICTVCAYCHEWVGVKDGAGKHGISHGVCHKCLERKPWMAEKERVARILKDGRV